MIYRLRRYRSFEEAVTDLSRLGMSAPPAGPAVPSALFVEGRKEEIQAVHRRFWERGVEIASSERGHRSRACMVGDDEDLRTWAELLPDRGAATRAMGSYHSDDAPPVRIPGGALTFDRPLVMGILNVTPDSFSDGGSCKSVEASVLKGLAMVEEGADIIDVGGESTRPGAAPVPLEEEIRRTVPVIKEIVARTDIPISVDTMKPEVAAAAVAAGAHIINDVTGLEDPRMIDVAAEAAVPVVLMHMLGTPQTMQSLVDASTYDDIVSDIMWRWEERMAAAEIRGLERDMVILDPGIGFAKLQEHNLEVLDRIRELRCAGRPVLIGASRKGFVRKLAGGSVEQRAGGSLAAASVAVMNGANIVRAHDVPETAGALRLIDAVRKRPRERR
ncbi:MAG: dihydropteroate synthase [Methanomassiliicoccus sp.]|nr:dihydropteroate synthase [Methanomassiliicoccus sp.]